MSIEDRCRCYDGKAGYSRTVITEADGKDKCPACAKYIYSSGEIFSYRVNNAHIDLEDEDIEILKTFVLNRLDYNVQYLVELCLALKVSADYLLGLSDAKDHDEVFYVDI